MGQWRQFSSFHSQLGNLISMSKHTAALFLWAIDMSLATPDNRTDLFDL